jgi:hypothetical protein
MHAHYLPATLKAAHKCTLANLHIVSPVEKRRAAAVSPVTILQVSTFDSDNGI